MASLISGIELLENLGFYSFIFPVIIVFAITYGILEKVQPFGEDKRSVNVLVAFVIGLFIAQFTEGTTFIQLFIPFVAVFIMLIMLIMLIFVFLGVKTDTIQGALGHPAVYGLVISVFLIGVFFVMTRAVPAFSLVSADTTDLTSETGQITISDTGEVTSGLDPQTLQEKKVMEETVFHPTILSLFVMLIVFGTATYFITGVRKAS